MFVQRQRNEGEGEGEGRGEGSRVSAQRSCHGYSTGRCASQPLVTC